MICIGTSVELKVLEKKHVDQTGVGAEVTRCRSQRENGTLAKDKKWGRKLILEKYVDVA